MTLLTICLGALITVRGPSVPSDTMHHIDHIILGVRDLDKGVREFEQRTGVTPMAGGEHPGAGTHNALVSLGDGHYVEILAPMPNGPLPNGPLPDRYARVPSLDYLTPVGWAVRSDDLPATRHLLAAMAIETSDLVPGSRRTPAGALLTWTTVAITKPDMAGAPFFIHWSEGTPHPSTTAPTGCHLLSFSLSDPAPASLARMMRSLNITVAVDQSSSAQMTLVLDCPKGRVTFAG